MKTIEGIKLLLEGSNCIAASQKAGMVYQVWEDGEITLQKSGELLWQRTLHCMTSGLNKSLPLDVFPEKQRETHHAYIFCESREIAEQVRKEIEDFLSNPQQTQQTS